MKSRFFSYRVRWNDIKLPILIGALVICVIALVFVILATHGVFNPSNYYSY